MENKTLAIQLKNHRKEAGLTQQQVADALNIKRSAYAYYETGKSAPKNNVLIKIAKLYRTTVDSLLNGVPQTENVNNPSIPYKEQWSTSDKLNELTDFEQIVLLKTRTMTSQERKDLLDYLTSMSKKNND